MKKERFIIDFVLGDLCEMIRDAGFSPSEYPHEVAPETLEHWEMSHNLPSLPKTMEPIYKASQMLMRYLVEVIRNHPPEMESK